MMTMKTLNIEFRAIMDRRQGGNKGVILSRIIKSGKPGKPTFYQFYGSEKTAEEVIARLERNNPGDKWIKAE